MNKEKKTVLPSTIDRLFTKYEERVNILKPYSFGEYTKLVDVLDSEFELVNIITFGKYQKILDKKLPYSKKIPILPHQHNCMTDIMKGVSKEISKEMIQRTVDKLKRYSIKDWNKYYLEDIKVGEVVDDIENGLDKIEMSYFQYLQLLNKDDEDGFNNYEPKWKDVELEKLEKWNTNSEFYENLIINYGRTNTNKEVV